MLKVFCEFRNASFCCVNQSCRCYGCSVEGQEIPENEVAFFDGTQELRDVQAHTNDDVVWIDFKDCQIPRIPYGLPVHFVNLTKLFIKNCHLKNIDKFDLRGLKNLTKLDASNNELENLPENLFEYTKELRYVYFANNKIKKAAWNLFDEFKEFFVIDFKGNLEIDLKYVRAESFDDFKIEFKKIFMKE
jgi:hypothetical protein